MQLKYSISALRDVAEAREYIALDNPEAAIRIAERIREALEGLLEYPVIGRPGRHPGTRELVVSGTPFIVVYTVSDSTIFIARVLHHARKWP